MRETAARDYGPMGGASLVDEKWSGVRYSWGRAAEGVDGGAVRPILGGPQPTGRLFLVHRRE